MARFEVRIAEGEDRTKVEVIEAGGLYWRADGTLVFCGEGTGVIRAFAAGCWQEVRKIEPAVRDPKDVVANFITFNPEILAAAAMVCTRQTWTKELPQSPSYYWVDRDGSVLPPRIVEVERWPGNLGFCYRIEGSRDFHDVGEPGLRWCGPIPKPLEAPLDSPLPPEPNSC